MRHGLLLLVLLLPTALAGAEDRTLYDRVPQALQALEISENDRVLTAGAVTALAAGTDPENARRVLVLLGDAGLKAAAERLAQGGTSPRERAALLYVIAAAEHPAADSLLAAAAHEGRPLYRMIAGHGLGRVRSPQAVMPLAALALDPVPAVRIAALRSLFAFESAAAKDARIAVPADRVPDLLARRLRWHRRAGDGSAALLAIAREAYLHSPVAALRTAAAHYLSLPALDAPTPLLEVALRETGGGPLAAGFYRLGAGLPQQGYDPVEQRRIAIQTVFTLLARKDATAKQRATWIRLAIAWVANPVPMDPYRDDAIPEHVLRQRLPDLGVAVVAPVISLLASGAFDDPRQGMLLLRELGPDIALPLLRQFLTPRTVRPVFESRAEAQQRRFLRGAAAGVMQELGLIGDEALARALLLGDEPHSLKVDITHALTGDPGSWVVPLLTELLEDPAMGLRKDAIFVLEKRPEPDARNVLIDDLFKRLERPDDRLRPLLRRGDDAAVDLMRRALRDKRSYLRKAALQQFRRADNPRLCRRAKDVLFAHVPDPASPQEIQNYLTALLNVDELRAVRYVDEHWDALTKARQRTVALRKLGTITGKEARAAAIDLALARVPAGAEHRLVLHSAAVFAGPSGTYAWDYRVPEIGARLQAMLASDDVSLQRRALKAWAHPSAPKAVARLLELLARALAGTAIPERDSTYAGEQEFARTILATLPHQPWAAIEPALLAIALEPKNDGDMRVVAAQLLIGKISAPARRDVAAWLGYTGGPGNAAPGRKAFYGIQLFLGAAVGIGADAELAKQILATLQRELWDYLSPERLRRVVVKGPATLFKAQPYLRVQTLARAVSSTKHVPSILAMLATVFDARLAGYAQVCVQRQAGVAHAAGPAAAAIHPSRLEVLGHNEESNPNWGMPLSIYALLGETGVLADDVLSEGLRRILSAARTDGHLARFPALYMLRVLERLLDPKTGRKTKTAAVIWHYARRMGTTDGAIHYFLHRRQALELADAGHFHDAALAQRDLVRALVRGNHEDHRPGIWILNRSVQDALAGAAAHARGDPAQALALFERAARRAPHDPDALNAVAWYHARAGYELADAEGMAQRATRLEARVETRPSANAADTLAYILLLRGHPRDGLRVLLPRMRETGAFQNGPLYYHLAQMHAALGRLRSARDALVEALTWDRALARDVEQDVFLKPLLEKLPFAQIQALAARERFLKELP